MSRASSTRGSGWRRRRATGPRDNDAPACWPASSSPSVVKLPFSREDAVDPEEALIASAASCHMLSFLYLAAKRGFVVDRYIDEAFGVMEKNEAGKLAITKITESLRCLR